MFSASRPLTRWREVALHACVVAVIGCLWFAFSDPVDSLRLGGPVGIVGYAVLMFREARKTSLRVSLLSAYFAFSLIANGIAPVLIAQKLSQEGYIAFVTVWISPEAVARGWLIFLLGSLLWHAGLEAGDRVPEVPAARFVGGRVTAVPSLAVLITLWLAGTAAVFVKSFLVTRLGTIGILFDRAPMAALALLLLLGPITLGISRRTWVILAGIGFSSNLLLSFTMNGKSPVILAFVPILWFLAVRRPGFLVPALFAVVAFYAMVVYPLIAGARSIATDYDWRYGMSVIHAVQDAGGVRALGEDRGGVAEALSTGAERFFQATQIGFLTDEVARTGFRGGETFRGIAEALIPRIFWQEKPIVTRGGFFRDMITGDSSGGGGAIAFSAAGEFYWNFGMPGVFVGMFLLGILFRKAYGLAIRPDTSIVQMVLFLQLLPAAMEYTDALSIIVSLIATIILYSGFLWAESALRGMRRFSMQHST